MAKVAERVGRGPCPNCGESVTFKRSSGGLLNFRCDACCSTGYAEASGPAYRKWSRTITPFEPADPAPAPGPAPGPAPTPAPAPPTKRAAFALGDLS